MYSYMLANWRAIKLSLYLVVDRVSRQGQSLRDVLLWYDPQCDTM